MVNTQVNNLFQEGMGVTPKRKTPKPLAFKSLLFYFLMDPFAKFKLQMLEDDDEDFSKDFKKLNLPSKFLF